MVPHCEEPAQQLAGLGIIPWRIPARGSFGGASPSGWTTCIGGVPELCFFSVLARRGDLRERNGRAAGVGISFVGGVCLSLHSQL